MFGFLRNIMKRKPQPFVEKEFIPKQEPVIFESGKLKKPKTSFFKKFMAKDSQFLNEKEISSEKESKKTSFYFFKRLRKKRHQRKLIKNKLDQLRNQFGKYNSDI